MCSQPAMWRKFLYSKKGPKGEKKERKRKKEARHRSDQHRIAQPTIMRHFAASEPDQRDTNSVRVSHNTDTIAFKDPYRGFRVFAHHSRKIRGFMQPKLKPNANSRARQNGNRVGL